MRRLVLVELHRFLKNGLLIVYIDESGLTFAGIEGKKWGIKGE
jgi:hypothetical protein